MLRTASHSQALGGRAGLHAHPERSEGEPDLAPVVEGEGVDREGGGEAAPDQAASQEEQLLISGGSTHLGTGTGLVASVAQEHSSWADANPEPAPHQVNFVALELLLCVADHVASEALHAFYSSFELF